MNLINQYSYLLLGITTIIGLFWLLRRVLSVKLFYVLIAQGVIAAVFIGAQIVLRPGDNTVSSAKDVRGLMTNGQPTFLTFFSNYCGGCLAFEPVVDTIINDIGAEFNIIRVDIHTDFGRQMRREYQFSFTPEFVLFNARGEEIWRDHIPPSAEQLDLAKR